MVHVAVNKYDFEKNQHFRVGPYAFGEGGGGHQKAYAVYAFINVDNCERPLRWQAYNEIIGCLLTLSKSYHQISSILSVYPGK